MFSSSGFQQEVTLPLREKHFQGLEECLGQTEGGVTGVQYVEASDAPKHPAVRSTASCKKTQSAPLGNNTKILRVTVL